MKTHKNPELRTSSVVKAGDIKQPAKAAPKFGTPAAAKPPKCELQGKKWIVVSRLCVCVCVCACACARVCVRVCAHVRVRVKPWYVAMCAACICVHGVHDLAFTRRTITQVITEIIFRAPVYIPHTNFTSAPT